MINTINGKRLQYCTIDELREYFIGRKYGRLTITNVERVLFKTYRRAVVDYICDCGTVGRAQLSNIIKGTTLSCGCLRKEALCCRKTLNRYWINSDYTVSVVATNNPNIIFTVDFHTWVWFSHIAWGVNDHGYMHTSVNGRLFEYHTLLYPVPTYGKYVRDHKNRCRFDNRYSNLRVISHSDNRYNTGKKDGCTTNIKGVYIDKHGKYVAMLNSSKHGIRLTKTFNTLEEAAAQRREWEEMYQTIEELIVPPLILPNGQLNVYNFPFGWYPEEYSSIWALLGLRVVPYSTKRSGYIDTASKIYRGDYSN